MRCQFHERRCIAPIHVDGQHDFQVDLLHIGILLYRVHLVRYWFNGVVRRQAPGCFAKPGLEKTESHDSKNVAFSVKLFIRIRNVRRNFTYFFKCPFLPGIEVSDRIIAGTSDHQADFPLFIQIIDVSNQELIQYWIIILKEVFLNYRSAAHIINRKVSCA
ncbi:hypothetical protein SDC9_156664 [bioreactor metagenome]|uniref:Uncharacterized protein n=1 Tax=bioreactor metagenome TaxID=1076179 RepID=A0A645F4V5_9ZZZZ